MVFHMLYIALWRIVCVALCLGFSITNFQLKNLCFVMLEFVWCCMVVHCKTLHCLALFYFEMCLLFLFICMCVSFV